MKNRFWRESFLENSRFLNFSLLEVAGRGHRGKTWRRVRWSSCWKKLLQTFMDGSFAAAGERTFSLANWHSLSLSLTLSLSLSRASPK